MRRSLVLTTETARHPFRASLPPHVFERLADDIEPCVPLRQRLRLEADDLRHFALAYCACLVGVTAFIA
ncbi:conserved hypothetical protein [Altererythrobacter sp. B11]|uniref:hypothetical protein n=1 Tax=Altererythrobacter sp. B11 TaxID=2060312 RepID=UPI000DC6F1E6|nr:hypothetical protein [Altererythrobacter sp. B11]BBC73608.1 conserved hypothetical protein [Altererythrobacter sp. B11]